MLTEAALNGPSWVLIGSAACAALSAMIAGYATGLRSRVDKLELKVEAGVKELRDEQVKLEKMLLRDYHDKQAISALLTQLRDSQIELRNGLQAVHRRLDKALSSHLPPESDHG